MAEAKPPGRRAAGSRGSGTGSGLHINGGGSGNSPSNRDKNQLNYHSSSFLLDISSSLAHLSLLFFLQFNSILKKIYLYFYYYCWRNRHRMMAVFRWPSGCLRMSSPSMMYLPPSLPYPLPPPPAVYPTGKNTEVI